MDESMTVNPAAGKRPVAQVSTGLVAGRLVSDALNSILTREQSGVA